MKSALLTDNKNRRVGEAPSLEKAEPSPCLGACACAWLELRAAYHVMVGPDPSRTSGLTVNARRHSHFPA